MGQILICSIKRTNRSKSASPKVVRFGGHGSDPDTAQPLSFFCEPVRLAEYALSGGCKAIDQYGQFLEGYADVTARSNRKGPEASHQSFPTHPAAITMGQEGLIGGHGRVRQLESFSCLGRSRADPIALCQCSESCNEPKPPLDSYALTFLKQLLFPLHTLYHITELLELLNLAIVPHCQLYLKHVSSNIPRVFF